MKQINGLNMMMNKLKMAYYLLKSQIVYRIFMHGFGIKSRIIKPMTILKPKFICIGKHVLIRNAVRLEVVDPQNTVVIKIGDNVNIEQNCHIIGRVSIDIGNDVTITGNCSIVDIVHPYEDINDKMKIGQRVSSGQYPVKIGDGTFIGFGTHISPGVTLGKYCIIGAGSVVTKDIPDYCVAAGVPAKIIKRYSHEQKKWIFVNKENEL
jgi:acetyltransferase-like isoleucine patch superfamily enzyme